MGRRLLTTTPPTPSTQALVVRKSRPLKASTKGVASGMAVSSTRTRGGSSTPTSTSTDCCTDE
jgi:hypothetical protein